MDLIILAQPQTPDGTWQVQTDDGETVFAGYRIDEIFAGENHHQDRGRDAVEKFLGKLQLRVRKSPKLNL